MVCFLDIIIQGAISVAVVWTPKNSVPYDLRILWVHWPLRQCAIPDLLQPSFWFFVQDEWTAMLYAARYGHEAVVSELASCGANVEHEDRVSK